MQLFCCPYNKTGLVLTCFLEQADKGICLLFFSSNFNIPKSIIKNYINCYGDHNRKQLLSADNNYFTFPNLFVTTPGLNPRFITNILLETKKEQMLLALWWGGLANLHARILSPAKPQGHKQLLKNLIIFVSIASYHQGWLRNAFYLWLVAWCRQKCKIPEKRFESM